MRALTRSGSGNARRPGRVVAILIALVLVFSSVAPAAAGPWEDYLTELNTNKDPLGLGADQLHRHYDSVRTIALSWGFKDTPAWDPDSPEQPLPQHVQRGWQISDVSYRLGVLFPEFAPYVADDDQATHFVRRVVMYWLASQGKPEMESGGAMMGYMAALLAYNIERDTLDDLMSYHELAEYKRPPYQLFGDPDRLEWAQQNLAESGLVGFQGPENLPDVFPGGGYSGPLEVLVYSSRTLTSYGNPGIIPSPPVPAGVSVWASPTWYPNAAERYVISRYYNSSDSALKATANVSGSIYQTSSQEHLNHQVKGPWICRVCGATFGSSATYVINYASDAVNMPSTDFPTGQRNYISHGGYVAQSGPPFKAAVEHVAAHGLVGEEPSAIKAHYRSVSSAITKRLSVFMLDLFSNDWLITDGRYEGLSADAYDDYIVPIELGSGPDPQGPPVYVNPWMARVLPVWNELRRYVPFAYLDLAAEYVDLAVQLGDTVPQGPSGWGIVTIDDQQYNIMSWAAVLQPYRGILTSLLTVGLWVSLLRLLSAFVQFAVPAWRPEEL